MFESFESTDALLKHFECALMNYLNSISVPAKRLHEAMYYVLIPGGKRIRPQLIYLTGNLLQVNPKALDAMAIAIELIHAYSLVHDDLPAMDDDDMRRGKPSCHKAFDEATAILVGDALQMLAMDILLDELPKTLPLPNVIAVTHELAKASGAKGMVSGQSLDLTELSKASITEDILTEIHDLKTSRLMLACINMVLSASDASPSVTHKLRLFAAHLGLAFQMQDDYLDVYGPKNTLGKSQSSDTANQKSTFAMRYTEKALEKTIQEHFENTKKTLDIFGDKANTLHTLVNQLLKRSENLSV